MYTGANCHDRNATCQEKRANIFEDTHECTQRRKRPNQCSYSTITAMERRYFMFQFCCYLVCLVMLTLEPWPIFVCHYAVGDLSQPCTLIAAQKSLDDAFALHPISYLL